MEATDAFQGQVDEYYRMFVQAVARGRAVSMEAVRTTYGEGRVVMAKAALAAGMVDRIDTLDNTIRRVARGSIKPIGLGPDATGDTAAASADSVSDLPALDPETVSAEAEEIAAMATKHAAARATEGRPLSAADRDRLARARGSIDSLLAEAPAPAKSGPSLRLALALAEADAKLAGIPPHTKE